MTGLHSPSIHFHIGAWAVTALCIFLAFWINFLEKRDLLPKFVKGILGDHVVRQLDYVAIVTGIVGFIGILGAAWTGFIDATGIDKPNYFDINLLILGYNTAMSNEILGFKVVWTFVGLQMFLFTIIIRTYFVTFNKEKSVFDQHVVVQILYAQSALLGFFMMVVIAGAGGIWVSGSSIISDIPVLKEFLPGGNGLIPLFFFGSIFSILLIISMIIKERE